MDEFRSERRAEDCHDWKEEVNSAIDQARKK